MQKAPAILVGVGVGLLILTFVMGWIVIPEVILKGKIEQKVRLVNGTQTWERWSDITTPIFMNYYFFNTTNPDEVKKGAKPIFEEFGPYVYQEKRRKIDITLNEENGTVSYRQPVFYYFREDLSNGSESDMMTVINVPLAVLTTLGASQGLLAQWALSGQVIDPHDHEEDLFMTHSVGELLFKGKHVPMMKTLEEELGKVVLKNHTFGFQYPKNGSDEGIMEVNTGVENSADFGKVVSWNGMTELEFWGWRNPEDNTLIEGSQYCNMINGSDGSIFPPFVDRDRVVRLFSADLCRSLYLKYTEDVELNGISGYRFSVPREMLEDAQINEDNACFCTHYKESSQLCLKSGAIQLSACRKGAPIVMSTPHFLDGSEEYLNQSIGLSPNKDLHQTFIELEPNTGLVLQAHKRIQVNIQLQTNTLSSHFSDVPVMIYPVLWLDEAATMSNTTAAGVKALVLKPLKVIDIAKWSLLGFSCLLIAIGLIIYMVQSGKHNYSAARTSEKPHDNKY